MTDPLEQFREAASARGLILSAQLEIGRFCRCDVEGRGGKGDGSYKLYLDGIPAGGFQNWKDGLGWENWHADIGRALTPDEKREYHERMETARREHEAERQRRAGEARATAQAIWRASVSAMVDYPYLRKKGVQPHGLRVATDEEHGGSLVVPVRDADGVLHSLQFIPVDGGKKRFLPGGRVSGCYFPIGKPNGVLCVAEGFATAASIHEATGHAVAVAFCAGNLMEVAEALHAKAPDLELVICADDDWKTKNNPGMTKAAEAAKAVGCKVAVPDFGPDRPEEGATDFNDLASLRGHDAVKECIEKRMEPNLITNEAEREREPPVESHEAAVRRLAALSVLDYERIRDEEARRLGVRVSALDEAVRITRKDRQEDAGRESMFPEVHPWPDPVNAAHLLDEILTTIRRHIVCDMPTAIATTLWIAFTWFIDAVQVAPLAVITAPEKRCGKSQLLDLIGRLSRRPMVASNISPAAVFRVVEAHGPTLLIDEADSFLKENEELRGIINSGHTRQSAYVVRTVGDDHEPRKFSTWGAKAIAGIGHLAGTLMDRAVVLTLRRKLPSEKCQRLRHADPAHFIRLVSMLARFTEDAASSIAVAHPVLPLELNDRAQDNWEPLLAIAEHVGGEWPKLARDAALHLSGVEQEVQSSSTELLSDIQEVFENLGTDRVLTRDLLDALIKDDLKPWATSNHGREMTPRQLASRLEGFGIRSISVRRGHITGKGYLRSAFEEAFARYIPSERGGQSVTPSQTNGDAVLRVADGFHDPSHSPSIRDTSQMGYESDVTAQKGCDGSNGLYVTREAPPLLHCDGVTDKEGGQAEEDTWDSSVPVEV